MTTTLPEPLALVLEPSNVDHGDVVIALESDLKPNSAFGVEWMVVTQDRLRVYGANGDRPHARIDVPLSAIRSPRIDSLVGGTALLAYVDGEPTEIIRYTNARQRQFSRAVKYLEDVAKHHDLIAKGEESKEQPRLSEDTDEAKRCPACNLLLPEGSKVCPACMSKGRVIARLLTYLRPYWKQSVTLSAMILVSAVLGLVAPYLTRPLMDVVLVPRGHVLPMAQRINWLGLIVAGMLFSQIAAQAINIMQGRVASWLTHQLAHDLRTQLYEKLQMLSLRYYDKRQVGAIMTRVTQDSQELESMLTISAQFFLAHILTLIGIGVVLLTLNWRMFLLAMLPAPFVFGLSRLVWDRIGRVWQRWWHMRSRMNAILNDSLSGIRVVKAFAQEQREIGRFNPRSRDLANAGLTAEQTWMTVIPVLSFITGTGMLIVWYVGGRQVLGGQVTLGTLMTFISYLGLFYGPLQFLNRIGEWLGRMLAAAERVFDILDSESDVQDPSDAVPMPRIDGQVKFDNIIFGYDAHKPVLKGVSLDVAAGEMIGLVGHSGAGKSTMINLLCRFYDVNDGHILIDGVDIKKIRQQDLRSQIGVVLQDTFLFNGTIAENIGYARQDTTREEIMAAAKAANAHDFIVEKPDGYDSIVGERGQSLSGGERQRISIARAILHNPRILILDEATSAVDTDTEKQIQDAIARLIKGRTTFAIAHRLSTLRNADRLVVLKNGKVEEMGTHDELLEKKGEFYRLVEMQQEMSKIKALAR